jgi:hypothetical protein
MRPILSLRARRRNRAPPPRYGFKAPQGVPNVLVILIDDLGYGAKPHGASHQPQSPPVNNGFSSPRSLQRFPVKPPNVPSALAPLAEVLNRRAPVHDLVQAISQCRAV